MRYLKVFGIPAFICICMTITMYMYPEKNSEETLNNSSEITNYESPSEEEINNVVETSSNDDDTVSLVTTAYAAVPEEPVVSEIPEPTQAPIVEESDAKTNSESYSDGIVKTVPKGRGSSHTFMGWQMITSKSSKQYKLRAQAGENYDSNGFAKIQDRYVVATKPYYGKVGDYIDVYKSNGDVIKCIIGDQKGSDGGGDKYGHADGSIVEFVADKHKWYKKYNGLGRYLKVSEFHPNWTKYNITKIVNFGNYWD